MSKSRSTIAILLLGLGVASSAQAARMFCCSDEQGVKVCGDILPDVCRSRAYAEFNERGQKVRTQDAPLSEAQQAARDAEQKKKRETDRLALEQQRRDLALLNTYANDQDLDAARDRQIKEIERSVKQTQDKLTAAEQSKTKLNKDLEFYKNKPVPADLKDSIKRSEADVQALKNLLTSKAKEIEDTKARFEADRQRLKELRNPEKAERK